MKQIYMSVLLVMLFTVNVFGEQHASKFGEKEKVAVVYESFAIPCALLTKTMFF